MNDLFNMPIKKGIDTLIGSTNDILEKVNTIINSQSGNDDEMFIINALLSEDPYQNEWAFRQHGIGKIINDAFALGSSALAVCNTVEEIAGNAQALISIKENESAYTICTKNTTLSSAYKDAEKIISTGFGYNFYNVGDLVELTYDGVKKTFRVVAKDHYTVGKIVLMSEGAGLGISPYDKSGVSYSTSALRTLLNGTILSKFSSYIQNAMVTLPLPCHDYSTKIICNDKIWSPSHTEMNFAKNASAPEEGTPFEWFTNGGNKQKNGICWTRTPCTSGYTYAWSITNTGEATTRTISENANVVCCFEI